MASELRASVIDPQDRHRPESLVNENLEFMARLSLIEQALPMLRMRTAQEIAESLLELLCAEAGADDGLIWVKSEPGGSLELLASRGAIQAHEEPQSWPGEPEALDEALHAGRTITEAPGSEHPGRLFIPCCEGDRLLAIARLEAGGPELSSQGTIHSCEKLTEIGGLALSGASERAGLVRSSLRDPLTDLPTRAFLDEVAKTELQKARRYGRRLCLLCVDVEGIDARRHAAELRKLVGCVERTVRTTDLLAGEGPSRYWVLLTDSDPLGGAVLKRRIEERLKDALAPHGSDLRPALGLASFPLDGETLPALSRAAMGRVSSARTSIVHELGIEADTSLASIGERLRERAQIMPGEIVSEAADLLIGELSCRPRDRGLLFFAPGQDSAAFLRPLTALGEAEVATDVFLATEEDTIPAGSIVTALGLPPQVSADTSWIVRFGEAAPYALIAWPRRSDGSRPVFHSSDRVLVEHMTFRLRSEVGFGMRA